jgi:hypothetical protein
MDIKCNLLVLNTPKRVPNDNLWFLFFQIYILLLRWTKCQYNSLEVKNTKVMSGWFATIFPTLFHVTFLGECKQQQWKAWRSHLLAKVATTRWNVGLVTTKIEMLCEFTIWPSRYVFRIFTTFSSYNSPSLISKEIKINFHF